MTDFVLVGQPEVKEYDVSVKYFIDSSSAASAANIKSKVESAFSDFMLWQRSRLGRDINPSELNHRLVEAGAKRTEISAPDFEVLQPWQVAIAANIELTYGGLEDG